MRLESSTPTPAPAPENAMLNELIREYLDFHSYRETASVMVPETGQVHNHTNHTITQSPSRRSMTHHILPTFYLDLP